MGYVEVSLDAFSGKHLHFFLDNLCSTKIPENNMKSEQKKNSIGCHGPLLISEEL